MRFNELYSFAVKRRVLSEAIIDSWTKSFVDYFESISPGAIKYIGEDAIKVGMTAGQGGYRVPESAISSTGNNAPTLIILSIFFGDNKSIVASPQVIPGVTLSDATKKELPTILSKDTIKNLLVSGIIPDHTKYNSTTPPAGYRGLEEILLTLFMSWVQIPDNKKLIDIYEKDGANQEAFLKQVGNNPRIPALIRKALRGDVSDAVSINTIISHSLWHGTALAIASHHNDAENPKAADSYGIFLHEYQEYLTRAGFMFNPTMSFLKTASQAGKTYEAPWLAGIRKNFKADDPESKNIIDNISSISESLLTFCNKVLSQWKGLIDPSLTATPTADNSAVGNNPAGTAPVFSSATKKTMNEGQLDANILARMYYNILEGIFKFDSTSLGEYIGGEDQIDNYPQLKAATADVIQSIKDINSIQKKHGLSGDYENIQSRLETISKPAELPSGLQTLQGVESGLKTIAQGMSNI